MLDFKINKKLCSRCGLCVADCPAIIIAMVFGKPAVHYARTAQHGPALINRFKG